MENSANHEMKKLKILIMSAPIGSGHILAAEALKEEFERRGKFIVRRADAFNFFPGKINVPILKLYFLVLKYFPGLYAIAYRWGNKKSGSGWLKNIINYVLAVLTEKYIEDFSPDCVIATHATPAGIMAAYKKINRKKAFFLAVVVTDYTVHKWWVFSEVDAYFVAAENLMHLGEAIPLKNVFPYGIPVRRDFCSVPDKRVLRSRFGWPEGRKVCLLSGGGEGLLPMQEILHALKAVQDKIHFVAFTGHNKHLAVKLQAEFPALEIHPFIPEIADFMHGADLIITKAGGLTAAETLTTRLKYLIYRPLPGQEEANALYLEKAGLAVVVRRPEKLPKAVEDVLALPDFAGSPPPGKPQATNDIVDKISELLQNKIN